MKSRCKQAIEMYSRYKKIVYFLFLRSCHLLFITYDHETHENTINSLFLTLKMLNASNINNYTQFNANSTYEQYDMMDTKISSKQDMRNKDVNYVLK